MATNTTTTSQEIQWNTTVGNGDASCTPDEDMGPPADFLRRRLGLRVPVWILALCAIYIAVRLIVDEVTKPPRKKFATHLKVARLIAACFTATLLIYNSLSILIEINPNVNCDWFMKSEDALYWINISVIYTVLWLRQRAIYDEPNLRRLVSKTTAFFSVATVVLVIALPVANSVIFSTHMDFCNDTRYGICFAPNGLDEVIKAGQSIVPILLPSTLLGLFAWPLIRRHQTSDPNARGQRSLISVLRRIVLVTVICLVTDLTTVACNAECDVYVGFIFRQLSAFSNLVCLVVSFADWRSVIFPCVHKKAVEVPTTSSTPGSHTTDLTRS